MASNHSFVFLFCFQFFSAEMGSIKRLDLIRKPGMGSVRLESAEDSFGSLPHFEFDLVGNPHMLAASS
jgi:hypothetical protein